MSYEAYTAHSHRMKIYVACDRGIWPVWGDGVGGNFWGSGEPIYNQRTEKGGGRVKFERTFFRFRSLLERAHAGFFLRFFCVIYIYNILCIINARARCHDDRVSSENERKKFAFPPHVISIPHHRHCRLHPARLLARTLPFTPSRHFTLSLVSSHPP